MEAMNYELVCPFETEWKFRKGDLIAIKDSEERYLNGKCFYSFNIPGLQYFVKIHPNGVSADENFGETWIGLFVNGSDERKTEAEFIISIESAEFCQSFNHVYEIDEGIGSTLCKTNEFFDLKHKYFVDGEITIKVNGIFKAERSFAPEISSPISMQWKISEEDMKNVAESGSGYLYSNKIRITSNVQYFLSICPNEKKNRKEPKSQIYLNVEAQYEKKIEAVFDFSIDSVNFNDGMQYIYDRSNKFMGYGTWCCSTEDLFNPSKGYIVDGFLTINLNGILIIHKKQHSKKYLSLNFVQNDQEKDFTIVVGDKEIKVHKQVLMDTSPVFSGMLESGMKESIENKMAIKDFPFEIVNVAIKLFYNLGVPRNFALEDILSLYQFADKYQINVITDLVENYLIKHISPLNVVQLIHFSTVFSVTKLHQSSVQFLVKCSKESTPVYGSESLGDRFLAMIFLNTLRPVVETEMNF
uniref:BTB domain-containing protein n=1 Tax=Panagrolaimus sp. ES5 TaxID=591445 RepID=A0AC34FEV7_9BILA